MNPFQGLGQRQPQVLPELPKVKPAAKPIRPTVKKPKVVKKGRKQGVRFPGVLNPWGLSPAQCAVMTEYVKGLTAREIGVLMGRSLKTIEVHLCACRALMGNVKRVQMAILWDRFEQSRKTHPAETAQPLAATGD